MSNFWYHSLFLQKLTGGGSKLSNLAKVFPNFNVLIGGGKLMQKLIIGAKM
jgi:hypothetical protein